MSAPPVPAPSLGVRFNLGFAPGYSKIPLNGPGPAPEPFIGVGAAPPQTVLDNSQFARPTRLFTLVFFAIALICCAIMGTFIAITLVRRRRQRRRFLQRQRAFGVDLASGQSRRHAGEYDLPPRVMPPLIEGVLVLHPDGEEQIACATKGGSEVPSPSQIDQIRSILNETSYVAQDPREMPEGWVTCELRPQEPLPSLNAEERR